MSDGVAPSRLPRGLLPHVGAREIVAAIHRRREGRSAAAAELRGALAALAQSVEQHLARIAELKSAIESQGGDLAQLRQHDTVMARLRAGLRAAERSLADAFRTAAGG